MLPRPMPSLLLLLLALRGEEAVARAGLVQSAGSGETAVVIGEIGAEDVEEESGETGGGVGLLSRRSQLRR